MNKLDFRFWKAKMNKLSRQRILGFTSEEKYLIAYLFITFLMISITMTTTICVAYILILRRQYVDHYIPVLFFFFGIIPTLVLILVQKLQRISPLNHMFTFLTVILWSLELPVLTTFMGFLIIIPWTLAAVIALILIITGYTMRKLCETASLTALGIAIGIIVLGCILLIPLRINDYEVAGCLVCGACVIFAMCLGLFLTGQCLKLFSQLKIAQLLLLWLPLVTWIQVIILFFSICAIYVCL
uniref:Uncharacterized protein n=1 Tax=Trichobilharzia regenti TaxID=157069 RepID=A0AA85K1G5_TRIRE|nr:unnamed protein product [Trichobilharzia regenti]